MAMNSILIFSIGFLLGLVFCFLAIYWHTKTNPLRLDKIQPESKDQKTDFRHFNPNVQNNIKHDEFMRAVFALIDEQLEEENLNVEQLAQMLHLSRSQLFRKIKERTGMSPSDLLRKVKLEKAHYLLQNPELNVTQVAYRTGFKDLAHFSKCFSKEFGLNPKRIKQQIHKTAQPANSMLHLSFG